MTLQHQYVRDILESGQHLLSLVNDVLDLAKIESGTMEFEPNVLDVRPLVERTVQMFRERAVRNGVRLICEVGDEVEEVRADERRLKQLLYNYLSNALKFTPEGGVIAVRVKQLRRRDSLQRCRQRSGNPARRTGEDIRHLLPGRLHDGQTEARNRARPCDGSSYRRNARRAGVGSRVSRAREASSSSTFLSMSGDPSPLISSSHASLEHIRTQSDFSAG